MLTGYAGYYLCRSDLSVAMPLLISDLAARGLLPSVAKVQLGGIASLGVLAYAVAKVPSGWLADSLGGRRNFLFGMGGAIFFTVLFGIGGGLPIFTLAWIGNRFVQSLGWAGMVKITSKWVSYSRYGTVMGIISLSFLFGDAASRAFLAGLISAGFGWRSLFFAAAVVVGVLFLINLLFLRETPLTLGLPEPPASSENLFRADPESGQAWSMGHLVGTLLRSPAFLLACVLSLGLTILRETFNLWTPTYFTQALGMSPARAAQNSALFPLFGGFSVILAGCLSDRLGRTGRASVLFYGTLFTAATTAVVAFVHFRASSVIPVVLVSLIGFVLIGPYSYLAGAMSLDFGGKQGSATASGLIDTAGYLGAVLAGSMIAGVSVRWGWTGAFTLLAAVALLSAGAAAAYLFGGPRQNR
jgi:OPA family glycerol-3-phosphate transporter-like MFS transporter